jgi:hypothetical protein
MSKPDAMTPARLRALLVGAWQLTAWTIEYPGTGRTTVPFGPDAQGLLLYTADGRMSAAMQRAGRARLVDEVLDRVSDADKARAFADILQYCGRWQVAGNEVHHDIEIAVNPNLLGTRQVRGVLIEGDRLTLTAHEQLRDTAAVRIHRVCWQRVTVG